MTHNTDRKDEGLREDEVLAVAKALYECEEDMNEDCDLPLHVKRHIEKVSPRRSWEDETSRHPTTLAGYRRRAQEAIMAINALRRVSSVGGEYDLAQQIKNAHLNCPDCKGTGITERKNWKTTPGDRFGKCHRCAVVANTLTAQYESRPTQPQVNAGLVEEVRSLDSLLIRYWEDEDFDECDPETLEDFDTPEKMLAYVTKKLRAIASTPSVQEAEVMNVSCKCAPCKQWLGGNPRPKPTHYTVKEGGPWLSWIEINKGNVLHSVRFEDGSEFDVINGWRNGSSIENPSIK
jgi:hypothetical protein